MVLIHIPRHEKVGHLGSERIYGKQNPRKENGKTSVLSTDDRIRQWFPRGLTQVNMSRRERSRAIRDSVAEDNGNKERGLQGGVGMIRGGS